MTTTQFRLNAADVTAELVAKGLQKRDFADSDEAPLRNGHWWVEECPSPISIHSIGEEIRTGISANIIYIHWAEREDDVTLWFSIDVYCDRESGEVLKTVFFDTNTVGLEMATLRFYPGFDAAVAFGTDTLRTFHQYLELFA